MTLRETLDVAHVLWGGEVGRVALDDYLAEISDSTRAAGVPQRSLEEDIDAWGESPDAQAALRALLGDEDGRRLADATGAVVEATRKLSDR